MQSSVIVSTRLGKKVLFIRHRFQEKNNFKGAIEREYIYFIGDTKPSLMIDFDVKKAFEEFVTNQSIQEIFSSSIWNLESLHVNYQQSSQDTASKQIVKDFITKRDGLGSYEQYSELAIDQLLNALYLRLNDKINLDFNENDIFKNVILRSLD